MMTPQQLYKIILRTRCECVAEQIKHSTNLAKLYRTRSFLAGVIALAKQASEAGVLPHQTNKT